MGFCQAEMFDNYTVQYFYDIHLDNSVSRLGCHYVRQILYQALCGCKIVYYDLIRTLKNFVGKYKNDSLKLLKIKNNLRMFL